MDTVCVDSRRVTVHYYGAVNVDQLIEILNKKLILTTILFEKNTKIMLKNFVENKIKSVLK